MNTTTSNSKVYALIKKEKDEAKFVAIGAHSTIYVSKSPNYLTLDEVDYIIEQVSKKETVELIGVDGAPCLSNPSNVARVAELHQQKVHASFTLTLVVFNIEDFTSKVERQWMMEVKDYQGMDETSGFSTISEEPVTFKPDKLTIKWVIGKIDTLSQQAGSRAARRRGATAVSPIAAYLLKEFEKVK